MMTSTKRIPVRFALANCCNISSDEIYDYIASNLSGSQLYTLRPGEGRKAAFDAVIVIGVISNVANIALVLFAAYDRFIAPTKRGASDNSGIYISVPKSDGTSIEICIGKDVLTQEQFKEGFTLAVESSISSEPDNIHDHIVGEVELSGDWDKH